MASSISSFSSIQADELRMKNYKNQLERKNEIDLRDMHNRHAEEILNLSETQIQQFEDLKQAYDIKISEEAEILEEKLNKIRVDNQQKVNDEKLLADQEVKKIKDQNQKEIEDVKKKSEIQISQLHKQYQKTSDNLHEQSKLSLKKEREKN